MKMNKNKIKRDREYVFFVAKPQREKPYLYNPTGRTFHVKAKVGIPPKRLARQIKSKNKINPNHKLIYFRNDKYKSYEFY